MKDHEVDQHNRPTGNHSFANENISPTSSPPRKKLEGDSIDISGRTEDVTEEEMMDVEIEAGSIVHSMLETRIKQLEGIVAEMQKQKIKDDIVRERLEEDNTQMKAVLSKKSEDEKSQPKTKAKKASLKPKLLSNVKVEHLSKLKGYKFIFKAKPNGACLTNCAAIHIHEDENEGEEVKKKVNNHIADNWENYYQYKVPLPYIETVGVGEDAHEIKKTTGEEMIAFLRSEESLTVFSNYQELLAIANLYNINIDVFSFGGSKEEWRRVCPDPEMVAETESGIPNMALYHSYDTHYDLLVKDVDDDGELQNDVNAGENENVWRQVSRKKQRRIKRLISRINFLKKMFLKKMEEKTYMRK